MKRFLLFAAIVISGLAGCSPVLNSELMKEGARDFQLSHLSETPEVFKGKLFILGGAIAAVLGAGFIPARKAGKLPWETVRKVFTLEYGDDTLEAHRDEFTEDSRIIVVDDVLATGGTAAAAADLVAQLNGRLVGYTFLLEILALKGRAALGSTPVYTVVEV